MTEKKFIETYCHKCGTQRCEGTGTEWFEGCPYRWNLDGYGDAAKKIQELEKKIEQLGMKLVHLQNSGWSKCSKCVYEIECEFQGGCSKFVKDPPDGGFYE